LRYDEFGALLRQLLLARGMNGTELGRQLGINKSSVHHWRKGNQRPKPKTIIKIADLFGYDRDDMLKLAGWFPGEPQPQPDPQRRAKHEKVDEWLNAVGGQYEALFWDALVAQAESSRALIDRLRTAVSTNPDPAISNVVSRPVPHVRKRSRSPRPPLQTPQHTPTTLLAA
jgi:transcriptional regulator with XRE-family HTH domain